MKFRVLMPFPVAYSVCLFQRRSCWIPEYWMRLTSSNSVPRVTLITLHLLGLNFIPHTSAQWISLLRSSCSWCSSSGVSIVLEMRQSSANNRVVLDMFSWMSFNNMRNPLTHFPIHICFAPQWRESTSTAPGASTSSLAATAATSSCGRRRVRRLCSTCKGT